MKKEKKSAIIGITILLIITLLLLGLTYAYYRTRVVGNSSTESIRAKGKKLEVEYLEGEAYFLSGNGGTEVLIEGGTKDKIEPGDSFIKKFNVINNSVESVNYSVKIDNITTTYNRMSDWTYKLIKVETDDSETMVASGTIPITRTYILPSINIDVNTTHNFKLIIEYANLAGVDQSEDMGAELTFRVTIDDETGKSEVFALANEGTLLKEIGYDNVITAPKTDPGNDTNDTAESVLASTTDDFGETYYFRGVVENNYVNFAGMCWRIVRIQGDSNIKLVLEDINAECNSETYTGNFSAGIGYFGANKVYRDETNYYLRANYLNPQYLPEKSMVNIFKTFETTLASKLNSSITDTSDRDEVVNVLSQKLVSGDWCYNDKAFAEKKGDVSKLTPLTSEQIEANYESKTTFYYESEVRLPRTSTTQIDSDPTLVCNGTIIDNYIDNTPIYASTLTADDYAFAGFRALFKNYENYLINDYVKTTKPKIFSLSLARYSGVHDQVYYFYTDADLSARLTTTSPVNNYVARPVVVLNKDVLVSNQSGNGTKDLPYDII